MSREQVSMRGDKQQLGERVNAGGHQFVLRLVLASLCLLVVIAAYAAMLYVQGGQVYAFVKQQQPVPMQGEVITSPRSGYFDSVVGWALKPDYSGHFLVPLGEPVPLRHDAKALRAPLDDAVLAGLAPHPKLLFLGDSFTYGSLLPYAETFPYQVAKHVGGTPVNAGVPSYGLAQMVMHARKVIPQDKPDVVVVQYSPWLVVRSEEAVVPSKDNLIMAPYFYRTGTGVMDVAPTAFVPSSRLVALMEHYKTTPQGFFDKLGFFVQVGVPFYLDRQYRLLKWKLGVLLGTTPAISTDTRAIIRDAYAEFDRLAKAQGAKLVIVALGTAVPLVVPTELFPKDALVVNAWAAQVAALDEPDSTAYIKRYFIWRGTPTQPVDWHPNAQANAITAQAVAKVIHAGQGDAQPAHQAQRCSKFRLSKNPWFSIGADELAALTLPEWESVACVQ